MQSRSKYVKSGKVVATVCLLALGYHSAAHADDMNCGRVPFSAPAEIATLVSAMEPVFEAFPIFQTLLTNKELELCMKDHMIEAEGYYEPENGRIVINGSLPLGLQQAILVHELRHVGQYDAQVCPSPDLSMNESARAVFAMEADASATNLVVAWAMRAAGRPKMWNALSTWPMQQDIAQLFEAEMTLTNDIALAAEAAFTQWYESEPRVQAYYIAACSTYLDNEDSSHRLRLYEKLDPAFFDDLCQLPNMGRYSCRDPR